MIIVYTIFYILLISVTFIDAQSCTTPDGVSGACVAIHECKPLLDTVKKKDRTAKQTKFLKDSQCGLKDKVPMVCCPSSNDCVTPDGKTGQCVSLYYCSHFIQMLLDTNVKNNMDSMRKSVCNGSVAHSVCCGPPREINPDMMTPNEFCTRALAAFSPEPDSQCCGIQDSVTYRIAGGKKAKITDYPWLVLIEYIQLGETKLLCGGSLISAKYVLTAAHCVTGPLLYMGTPKYVRLGEYNTTYNGPDCVSMSGGGKDCTHPVVIIPIEKTIPHPDYKPSDTRRRQHDIGLIRLKIEAFYTDFIRPICLPSMDYIKNPPEVFNFLVAGWGQMSDTTLRSEVRQYVKVPYVDRDKCQESLRTLRGSESLVLGNGQLCAGGETGKDSCKGDSGGPLMYDAGKSFEIVGVVSVGHKDCGKTNIPGIYTYVYEYLPWIRNTIKV